MIPEFWLGLRKISEMTSEGNWELVVELTDYTGTTYTARYNGFRLADAAEKYRLEYDSYDWENSTVGMVDALVWSKRQKFTTVDQDNDGYSGLNCSGDRGGGGWWYSRCATPHLTGLNLNNENDTSGRGVRWFHNPTVLPAGWDGSWPVAEMKIRRTLTLTTYKNSFKIDFRPFLSMLAIASLMVFILSKTMKNSFAKKTLNNLNNVRPAPGRAKRVCHFAVK